ncbi:MAG: 50S ribosomal protein L4 [Candidatus Omnitrophota bacterium]|nr:50S ribosomal protein L4 [Candidatus Omnitrophota bacterium]
MKVPVYSKAGKKKKEMVLNPDVFGARVNERLLQLVYRGYRRNLRHGTADTKVRKEVRGGGRKPWKQKGTGRARASSTRSPIWRGGGTVFGPHPRDYSVDMPRSMRRTALISAVSKKARQKNLVIVEDLNLESAKTKEFVEIIKSIPLQSKRTLCVVKEITPNLKRASKNVSWMAEICAAQDVNAYKVLHRAMLLIEMDAIAIVEERAAKKSRKKELSSVEGDK